MGLGAGQSSFLGRLAQAVLVLAGIVIGIDQLGVNVNFLIQLTTVTAAVPLRISQRKSTSTLPIRASSRSPRQSG